MASPFDYVEYTNMLKNYDISFKEKTYQAGDLITIVHSTETNNIFLIKEGFVSTYFGDDSTEIYTILAKNNFFCYFPHSENFPKDLHFYALTDVTVYIIDNKEFTFSLSAFPENFGFHYLFSRDVSKHAFYRSILYMVPKQNRLLFALKTFVILFDLEAKEGKFVFPKELNSKILKSYTNLSKKVFYTQLNTLYADGIVFKKDKHFEIDAKSLDELEFLT